MDHVALVLTKQYSSYKNKCKKEETKVDTSQKKIIIDEKSIQDMQESLNKLIAKHGSDNLLHPEVISFSQLLDEYITAYIKQSE